MNTKQLIALSVFAFAGSAAMAGEISVDNSVFVATKSRAQVQAEVIDARAAGTTQFVTEANVGTAPAVKSTLTREAVRAEAVRTRGGRGAVVTENNAAA